MTASGHYTIAKIRNYLQRLLRKDCEKWSRLLSIRSSAVREGRCDDFTETAGSEVAARRVSQLAKMVQKEMENPVGTLQGQKSESKVGECDGVEKQRRNVEQ